MKSLRTAEMVRTLNKRSPEHEAGVPNVTYSITVDISGIPEDYNVNCT